MNGLQPRADHRFNPFEPHPELDDIDISNLDGMDWLSNSDPFGMFSSRGIDAPKVMSPADASSEARRLSSKVFAHWQLLQAIIERHEAKIQKRWEKRTKTKRVALCWKLGPACRCPIAPTLSPSASSLAKLQKQQQRRAAPSCGRILIRKT